MLLSKVLSDPRIILYAIFLIIYEILDLSDDLIFTFFKLIGLNYFTSTDGGIEHILSLLQ